MEFLVFLAVMTLMSIGLSLYIAFFAKRSALLKIGVFATANSMVVLITVFGLAMLRRGRSPQAVRQTRVFSGADTTCKSEGASRSTRGDVRETLLFRNEGTKPLRLYWLDYGGRRILMTTLLPRDYYSTNTFVTHPWLFVEAAGSCIHLFSNLDDSIDTVVVK